MAMGLMPRVAASGRASCRSLASRKPVAAVHCPAVASSSLRGFASSPGGPDAALKADFKRWLRKEVVLLAALTVAGVTGIQVYQNREGAPAKQVESLVKQAEQSAKEGDREQALKHCLHAYDVVKATNPRDRHLFELAFAIAAQYETLGRVTPATTYYLDALDHLSAELNVAKRERNRVVALDRVAQCYENRGQLEAAERYFKQAIKAYDRHRGRRELSKTSYNEAEDLAALDREIPGVLFNYAQLLMAQKRWGAARVTLQRAKTLARLSSLSEDHVELIEGAIDSVRAAKAAEAAETEGQL